MAVELATAYVSLVPSARGITTGIQRELGAPVEAAARESGAKASAGFSNSFTSGTSKVKGLLLGAIGGAGAIEIAKTIADATGKEDAANARLAVSLKNSGSAWTINNKAIEEAVKTGEHFGNTAAQTKTAISILTTALGSPAKAVKDLGLAQDLAAKTGKPLAEAAIAIAKAQEGQLRPLKQLGIDLPVAAGGAQKLLSAQKALGPAQDAYTKAQQKLATVERDVQAGLIKGPAAYKALATAQAGVKTAADKLHAAQQNVNTVQGAGAKILELLGQKLKGSAAAQADTFAGKVRALKATLEDLEARIGEKVIPILLKLGSGVAGVVKWFQAGSVPAKALEFAIAGVAASFVAFKTAKLAIDGVKTAMDTAKKIADGFSKTIEAGSKVVGFLKNNINLTAAAQKIWNGVQAAFNVIMDANPIVLVVVAIAALVAGVILAYQHFKTFRDIVGDVGNALKTAGEAIINSLGAAFNWVKKNWPLLLAILTGPIGLAVLEITRHWDAIKNGFTAVKDWIGARVGDIVGFITGIPGRIAKTASTMWNAVRSSISSAADWVGARIGDIVGFVFSIPGRIAHVASTMWNGFKSALSGFVTTEERGLTNIVTFVAGLPGKIARAAAGMWDGIKNAFRAAINAIIDIWNGLHFKLPGFHVGPVHFGGFTLGVPHLPHVAQGGVFTQATPILIGEDPRTTPEIASPVALLRKTFLDALRTQPAGRTIDASITINAPVYGVDDLNAWADRRDRKLALALAAGASS